MALLTARPALFRAFLLATAGILLVLAGVSLYRYGSIPTDENLFITPPSPVYALDSVRLNPVSLKRVTPHLLPGDLIVSVSTLGIGSVEEYRTILRSASGDSLTVMFHRLVTNTRFNGRVATRDLESLPVRVLPPSAFVTSVLPGGASDRAGMKVGDLIVAINGQTFATIQEADRLMRLGQSGKELQYEILRENRPMTLQVRMAAFGFPFGVIVLVVSGILWIAAGLFLGLSRPAHVGARLLGIFFVLLGFGITVLSLRREPAFDLFVFVRDIARSAAFLLSFPVALHIDRHFPVEVPGYASRKWLLPSFYSLAAAGVIAGAAFGETVLSLTVVGVAICHISIAIALRKEKPPVARQLMRPVKIATSIGITAAVVISLSAAILSPFTDNLSVSWGGFGGVPLLLIPASYLYVIGRHKLFGMNLRIRRNLQYMFAATSWRIGMLVLFIGLLAGLSRWDPDVPDIQLTGSSLEVRGASATGEERRPLQNLLIVGAALLLTAAVWKTGSAGLSFLDRRFYRSGYDYRRAINELSAVTGRTQSMTELARGMVERLAMLMRVKRAVVLFFRDETMCCGLEMYGVDNPGWMEFCLASERAVAEALRRVRGPVPVTDLPLAVAEEFRRCELAVAVPVFSKERLIGALVMGEKESESAFHEEDFAFLSAAANQASVAIENSFLYEELAEQERMRHELGIARRIQLESLPQTTPEVKGLDIAGSSVPALEVGGDYYDYLGAHDGALTVIVGDVSGKGTSAALYMSKVQGIMRSLHGFGLGPRELLLRANALLYGDIEKRSFVTAVGARFDSAGRTAVIARAGHVPVYHFRAASGSVTRVLPRGLGLGLSPGGLFQEEIEEVSVPFAEGDVFVFVTDGVTEAEQEDGEQFGEERLMSIVGASSRENAAAVRDAIFRALERFAAGAKQGDDRTIVVVRATALRAAS